jgi:hypothetical protein
VTKKVTKPGKARRLLALLASPWSVEGRPPSARKAKRLQQMAERQQLGAHAPKSVREARRTDAGSGQGPAGMFSDGMG